MRDVQRRRAQGWKKRLWGWMWGKRARRKAKLGRESGPRDMRDVQQRRERRREREQTRRRRWKSPRCMGQATRWVWTGTWLFCGGLVGGGYYGKRCYCFGYKMFVFCTTDARRGGRNLRLSFSRGLPPTLSAAITMQSYTKSITPAEKFSPPPVPQNQLQSSPPLQPPRPQPAKRTPKPLTAARKIYQHPSPAKLTPSPYRKREKQEEPPPYGGGSLEIFQTMGANDGAKSTKILKSNGGSAIPQAEPSSTNGTSLQSPSRPERHRKAAFSQSTPQISPSSNHETVKHKRHFSSLTLADAPP